MAIERPARHGRQQAGHSAVWGDQESDVWSGEGSGKAASPLTAAEAAALRTRNPSLSPWKVVGAQLMVGAGAALLAVLLTGQEQVAWSMLYGSITVVVPGALMARGMTSRLTSMSPASSAVSFMLWELVKIAVSVFMLAMAPRIVPELSWPALLVGLFLGLKVYWLALLWRGRG